jgi:hypothetical protein
MQLNCSPESLPPTRPWRDSLLPFDGRYPGCPYWGAFQTPLKPWNDKINPVKLQAIIDLAALPAALRREGVRTG